MAKTKSGRLQVIFESDIKAESVRGTKAGGREAAAGEKGKIGEYAAIATVPLVLVLGNSMLIPVLPDLKRALNITQFQTSLIITLFSVTSGAAIPVIGFLSDRFGRKAVIIPALALYGSAGLLAGLGAVWESYWVVISARVLQGLGAAGTAPIAMALVGDKYSGGTESKVLGLTEASNGIGKVLSPIIGSLLAIIVWYAAFFAFPAFCLLSLLAMLFMVKEPDKGGEPKKLKDYLAGIASIFRQKGRWLITSFFAGSSGLFILFGVLFYLSDILEKKPHEIDGVVKGLVLAVPLMGMVIASYTTGALIKKNGVLIRRLMNIGLILSTASLVMAVFFYRNIYVFIGLLTLSGIGTGMLLPCLNTMITGSVEKSERGMITSLYSSLRFFGVAFGPPLFGWLMAISHQAVFIAASALSLVTLALVFFLIKPDRNVG